MEVIEVAPTRRRMKLVSQRWVFVGLVVENRHESALEIQKLLTEHGDAVLGRLGVPLPEVGVSAIGLILDGSQAHADVLTGELRKLNNIQVSTSSLTSE
jgi:putative iron-only hydrogenase system regulator